MCVGDHTSRLDYQSQEPSQHPSSSRSLSFCSQYNSFTRCLPVSTLFYWQIFLLLFILFDNYSSTLMVSRYPCLNGVNASRLYPTEMQTEPPEVRRVPGSTWPCGVLPGVTVPLLAPRWDLQGSERNGEDDFFKVPDTLFLFGVT